MVHRCALVDNNYLDLFLFIYDQANVICDVLAALRNMT